MKLTLHHINIVSDDVARSDRFYCDIIGLDSPAEHMPDLDKTRGYSGDVSVLGDGTIQTHLAQKDVGAGFRTGQMVNPVSHGHIAYRCDDIEAFKAHLDAHGVPYADWGQTAVKGWHQVFFYDPDGNVIEVHQIDVPPLA